MKAYSWLMSLTLIGCGGFDADRLKPWKEKKSDSRAQVSEKGQGETAQHNVEPTIKPNAGRSCYSAIETTQPCSSVDFWGGRNALTAFPSAWDDSKEGQYWFCPIVDNCSSLSMNDVAGLLCKFTEKQSFPLHVSVRSICLGSIDASGTCCFGVDAGILYD